ncbi:hypothetical protein NDI56_20445 [Haloarcula sp. S1CR25-12]|jgi:hypothetical protein|uniref:Formyl transferase N-terminal domain-containing protein n=1 Tax=Haloarcula saliterrae TaxID=2950534 RepID=A0ABU2FHN9_9EURY|nr:formyltransferase family protein [Haloarcula sp. S1CR25-12]MDS0261778.1 hypothetical protein [Haloarcula sp. S1CR25-12]
MSNNSTTEIRVAVLVGSEHIERWRWNALAALATEPDIRITHVVVNEGSSSSSGKSGVATFVRDAFRRFREYPLWSLVGVGRILSSVPVYSQPLHIDAIPEISSAERLSCSPITVDELWNELPEETIDRLEGVDVIVRFGFGMLKGRVLTTPTYGVLSYHPGDIRVYRGQPGGFWEFLNSESQMGVTVQRLNETLDGGEIAALESIDTSDLNTWQEIKVRAYTTAERMLVPAVRTVTSGDVKQPDQIGELYRIPKGWDVIRYLAKNTQGRVRNFTDTVRRSTGKWIQPGTVALLILIGLLNAGLHPLFSHHYIIPIHLEQILGLVLLVGGFMYLLGMDRHHTV